MIKSYTKYLWFNTKNRYDIINITDQVGEAIDESRVKEGLCLVNAMHITASVFTNTKTFTCAKMRNLGLN